jgi:hypothetical protein
MDNKLFWTLSPKGEEVLRDLEEENKEFSTDDYFNGKFDANNYQWYEMFNHYVYDDLGCDYERYGCYIQEGDVVLDLGGNIGVFAHRAETRGASKVISFEPITPTFRIHTDFTHIGGGTSEDQDLMLNQRPIIHSEKVIIIGINEIFEDMETKIDFMKIDIEGGEVDVLTAITNDNLNKLRCLAAEFHKTNDDFDVFQSNFINRMDNLGFNHFTVYHGNGGLRTLTFWKR